jgi:hypothetical protein
MKLTIRTREEIDAEADAAKAQRAADEARAYLASTDWLVTRFAETGKPVPKDVARKRADARKAIQ